MIFKLLNFDIVYNNRNILLFNEEKYYIIVEFIRYVEKEKIKCNFNNW